MKENIYVIGKRSIAILEMDIFVMVTQFVMTTVDYL